MRLFRFITGANEDRRKIAMTTPVFMSGGDSNHTMAFVLPATMDAAKVPRPAEVDSKVWRSRSERIAAPPTLAMKVHASPLQAAPQRTPSTALDD